LPFFLAFSERCIDSWEGKCSLIVALGVFFPMYLDTHHGVCTLGPQLIEKKMSDAELFWRVEPVDRENSEYFEEAAMSGFGTFLTWREV
jgi:hypothetical protein